jgi:hypothetical protein
MCSPFRWPNTVSSRRCPLLLRRHTEPPLFSQQYPSRATNDLNRARVRAIGAAEGRCQLIDLRTRTAPAKFNENAVMAVSQNFMNPLATLVLEITIADDHRMKFAVLRFAKQSTKDLLSNRHVPSSNIIAVHLPPPSDGRFQQLRIKTLDGGWLKI